MAETKIVAADAQARAAGDEPLMTGWLQTEPAEFVDDILEF